MKVTISEDDLDVIYEALEDAKPVPARLFGSPVLTVSDMADLQRIREVLFRLKEQDGRWIRAQ